LIRLAACAIEEFKSHILKKRTALPHLAAPLTDRLFPFPRISAFRHGSMLTVYRLIIVNEKSKHMI
jgi:hypothetical protein